MGTAIATESLKPPCSYVSRKEFRCKPGAIDRPCDMNPGIGSIKEQSYAHDENNHNTTTFFYHWRLCALSFAETRVCSLCCLAHRFQASWSTLMREHPNLGLDSIPVPQLPICRPLGNMFSRTHHIVGALISAVLTLICIITNLSHMGHVPWKE